MLEQDILDAAWATLETKYPELILEGCSRPPGPLKELENLAMPTGTDGDQVQYLNTCFSPCPLFISAYP